MSTTFTKLFASITESTVWFEPDTTRLLWIAMLAMADRHGRVWGSIPGLAHRARISIEAARIGIDTFLAPDPESRTPDHEGRRIEAIDGGWRLLNHEKYRKIRDEESRKESKRRYINERRRREREAKAVDKNVDTCRKCRPNAEADTDVNLKSLVVADATTRDFDKPKSPDEAAGLPKPDRIPYEKIVAEYHDILPMLPKVQKLTEARKAQIRARWTSKDIETLDEWRMLFERVAKSRFLTGQCQAQPGHKVFRANLEWIVKEANFTKIIEGNYDN